jgi:hypothetical protein
MRFLVGFACGVAMLIAFPNSIEFVTNAFVESGIREWTVMTLQGIGDGYDPIK